MAELTHDQRINELKERIASLMPSMKVACDEWLDATAPVLAQFWEAKVEETVVEDTEHTKALGKKRLAKLKQDVAQLVGNARTEAQTLLVDGAEHFWPHLHPEVEDPTNEPYTSGGDTFSMFRLHKFDSPGNLPPKGPYEFDDTYNRALENVEPLLSDAGYEPKMMVHDGYGMTSGKSYGWSREMFNAMNRYADLHEQLLKAQRGLRAARRDKERDEAKDLWNEA